MEDNAGVVQLPLSREGSKKVRQREATGGRGKAGALGFFLEKLEPVAEHAAPAVHDKGDKLAVAVLGVRVVLGVLGGSPPGVREPVRGHQRSRGWCHG